jgi:proline iminopeptidase
MSDKTDAVREAEKLFGDEHVRRYRETGGEVGHIWREGSTILLLTTKGRTTGDERTVPLIYAQDGDRYVIVASKGGAPEHPGWYKNLEKTREVELQVKDQVFRARARDAQGEERERLWRKANEVWPHYDEYATKTDREIPVVVLERI